MSVSFLFNNQSIKSNNRTYSLKCLDSDKIKISTKVVVQIEKVVVQLNMVKKMGGFFSISEGSKG